MILEPQITTATCKDEDTVAVANFTENGDTTLDENLEILSFIFWPALLWIGIALNPLRSGEQYV